MNPLFLSFYKASDDEVEEYFKSQNKCKYEGKVVEIYKSHIPAGECFGQYNYYVKTELGFVFPGCSYLSNECFGDGPCGSSNLTEIYQSEPKIGEYISGIMNNSGMILRVGIDDYNSYKEIPVCKDFDSLQEFQKYQGLEVDMKAPIYLGTPINYNHLLWIEFFILFASLIIYGSKKFKLLKKKN